jgi:hypothetical protein
MILMIDMTHICRVVVVPCIPVNMITLENIISEMIRNSDTNDPQNTEIHRDMGINVVISGSFGPSRTLKVLDYPAQIDSAR